MRNWSRKLMSIAGGFVFVAFLPAAANAQGAREYLNTPVNQLSGFIDFVYSEAESAAASGIPLPNSLTVSRMTVPYLLYSFPLNHKYGGVSITTPFSRVEGPDGIMKTTGFADPSIAFHANIFGLPALTREEIATATPQTFLTVHFTFNPPVGSYDPNSPVNVGGNRWSFSPLVNFNYTPDKGVSWIEAYASGRFFTDNHEFQQNKTLTQQPMLTLTGHYSHNIGKRYWASIGANYDYGGETTIENVPQNNISNGLRPIAAISGRFGPVRLTFRYENTATKANDAKRNGSIGFRIAALLF